MREIIIDIESTGLDTKEDRIIELAAVEIVNMIPTGRTYNQLIHPGDRRIHKEAQKVHGITLSKLRGKPTFDKAIKEFLFFIGDAPIIAHNGDGFDFKILKSELERCGRPPLKNPTKDTLTMAKAQRPGKKASLDALCSAFNISTVKRIKHEALIDCELLAEVYVNLMGGRQRTFADDLVVEIKRQEYVKPDYGPRTFVSRITPEEQERHAAFVATIKDSIWSQYLQPQLIAAE